MLLYMQDTRKKNGRKKRKLRTGSGRERKTLIDKHTDRIKGILKENTQTKEQPCKVS